MSQLFVLFEHATGYALFRTSEFEEISMLLPEVEEKMQDLAMFRTVVHLNAFMPFKTARDALENVNSISEGIIPSDLQLFLETNVPKSKKKKQPVVLGIADSKIGAAITEVLGMNCQTTGIVPEIIRGIRQHFPNLIDGLKGDAAFKAQLGLGHNYSRAKVKFNVNKVDNMIIQSISLLDQLDKDINTFAMRIREWYSYHFPELIKIVPENHMYAKVVGVIKDRKAMPENVIEQLEEILQDSTKVENILSVSRSSMGMDISPLDLLNIETFSRRVVALADYRKQLMGYLKSKMHGIAPNLATLIGEVVGARLISHAGSLTNLAKFPASTVQILGAEKALFRALKTRGNTPKYGLIFHSTFIGRAAKQNKGRISRYLANKCSMASRIDCFSEIPTEIFGMKLKQQVEDRLKFYETGEIPAKNLDVMTEATDEAVAVQAVIMKKKKKKAKKEKKRQEQEALGDSSAADLSCDMSNSLEPVAAENGLVEDFDSTISPKKKRKRKQMMQEEAATDMDGALNDVSGVVVPKKKKKKIKEEVVIDASETLVFANGSEVETSSKKKKKKNVAMDDSLGTPELGDLEYSELSVSEKGKKKKKKNVTMGDDLETSEYLELTVPESGKKKKKKKIKSEVDG